VVAAFRLAVAPPPLFRLTPGPAVSVALATLMLAAVAVAAHRRWYGLAAVVVAVGAVVTGIVANPGLGAVAPRLPHLEVPPVDVWGTAFVLLVIPQLPLTYGNAVVGMADLARERFPAAARVHPDAVSLSCGLGNVAAALVGGMPMCHGSSGFSAHVRMGATTARMNVLLGGALVTLGVLVPDQVLVLFGLLPVWALAGMLAYAGLRHAWLVTDLRGAPLVWAVAAAVAGVVTGNLAVTTVIALAAAWLPRLRPFSAPRPTAGSASPRGPDAPGQDRRDRDEPSAADRHRAP
jgi:sulfate permease, SulP family